jgi:hypothetical protein
MKRVDCFHSPAAAAVVLGAVFLVGRVPFAWANAQTIGSVYTSTAPKDCEVKSAENGVDDSTIRVCPGKAGLVVLVSEEDLRETVSVGRNRKAAEEEPAAKTWFGPFNWSTETLEWRHIDDFSDEDKNGRPKAKPMLAVTRLPPGAVCHVAYVDVAANPNANELARKAADELARGFDCGKDKVKVVGESGRAVELAVRR